MYVIFVHICCRAPRGARGLKYGAKEHIEEEGWSRPARGAWIEMGVPVLTVCDGVVAPREGRVD